MRHEDYKQMIALEAVGGLQEEESRSLVEHLAACNGCRVELEQLRATAATLVYTVAAVEPPAELRTLVLESVRGLKQPDFKDAIGAEETGEFAAIPSQQVGKDSEPIAGGFGAWQLVWSTPALRYGAMAAAAIIVTLSLGLAAQWKQTTELRAEVKRISESLQEAEREMAREGEEMAHMREAVELLSAPEAPVVLLSGTDDSPRSRGKLVYDRQAGRVLLFVSGLPPAPAGKAYQLWYIVGSKPLPGGVFTTGAGGEAVLRDRMPEGGHEASIFAVTLEPAGGVQSPTGDKYLLSAAS